MISRATVEVLTELRQKLHQHAELSGAEFKTQQIIRGFLEQNCPSAAVTPIAETGLLVSFSTTESGPGLLFRSDIDALPILDRIDADYRSLQNGVGHKCGHDGHATILCGLALHLHEHPPEAARVSLLFQPAEETGEGAKRVLATLLQDQQLFDFVFALHNIPGEELGRVFCKVGPITTAVISMIITLEGRRAHAAEPWHAINPSLAIGNILAAAHSLEEQNKHSDNFAIVTPVYLRVGSPDYGISPADAELHFTLRCKESRLLDEKVNKFRTLVNDIAQQANLSVDYHYLQAFEPCINEQKAVAMIADAAAGAALSLTEMESSFSWGEDFGLFTQHFKGALFGIGAGETVAQLHDETYDFPDALIAPAVEMFKAILKSTATYHV